MLSGFASFFAEILNDPSQLAGDAGWLYENSRSGKASQFVIDTQQGGIIIMTKVYSMFHNTPIQGLRYIGVSFNNMLVSFSSVIALKICEMLYDRDIFRVYLFKNIIFMSPILWLFATTHLRDALVLFFFAIYLYAWIYLLTRKATVLRLNVLLIINVLSVIVLTLIRNEYLFLVPVLSCLALMVLINRKKGVGMSVMRYVQTLFLLLIIIAVLSYDTINTISGQIFEMYRFYHEAVKVTSNSGLGFVLIVDQVIPIRLMLGFVYIFLHPIPFWAGSPFTEVYDLFKSLNAIYYYIVAPSIALGVWTIWKNRQSLSPALLFVFISFLLLISAVVMTSLETRHIGVFVFLTALIAVSPDYRNILNRYRYKSLLKLMLSSVFIVHMLWIIVKI